MKTYKFKYMVTSERVSYIYAESLEQAMEKIDDLLVQGEISAIAAIQENYVETVNEKHLGIDFSSIKEVPEIEE